MTAAERAERTRAADELCQQAFGKAGCPDAGVALVAVGGYGTEEVVVIAALAVIVIARHAANVRRLFQGRANESPTDVGHEWCLPGQDETGRVR